MPARDWGLLILGASIINTFVVVILLLSAKVAEINPEKVLNGLSALGKQNIATTILGFAVATYLLKYKK